MKTRTALELDAIEQAIDENRKAIDAACADLGVMSPLYIKARLGDEEARAKHNALDAERERLSRIGHDLGEKRTEILGRFNEERRQIAAIEALRAQMSTTIVGGIISTRGIAVPLTGTLDEKVEQVQALRNEHQAKLQKIRDEQQALYIPAKNGDTKAQKRYNALIDEENALVPRGHALQECYSQLMRELSGQREVQRLNQWLAGRY